MKKILMIIGGIFSIIGIIMLFSSFSNITGFVILENFSVLWRRILSATFIVVGLAIISVGEINKAIKEGRNLEEKVGYGKNVEIDTIFIRHGEDKEGNLTDVGKEQVRKYGEGLSQKDVIKGYSGSVQRAIETTENIVNSAPHNKKLKTEIRKEIGVPPFSESFMDKWIKMDKEKGEDIATDWYLNMGNKKYDKGTTSPREIAEGFAYMLRKNIQMSGKLYSGSKVDLIGGTHQALPESLLKEVMIRNIKGKKVVGFDSVSDIGGALKYAEPVKFIIKRDDKSKSYVKLDFRGKEYDVDMNRLNQLANTYVKRIKKRK